MPVPKKVCERLASALRRMGPILEQQRQRDVSEADTVTLVKDLLAEAFGYDKYADLTSEFAIRGTYCDLAVRIDEKVALLVEVKAIGISLEDRHVRQAIDYAANNGVEWVVLTNGATWRLYEVVFAKPIEHRLVAEIDLATIDCRVETDVERLFTLTREGFTRGAHLELRDRQDATSRFLIAALLTKNEAVAATVRRELRRIVDVMVTQEEIENALRNEVVKRDCLEGPEAQRAAQRVGRAERARAARKPSGDEPALPAQPTVQGITPAAEPPPA